MKTSTPAISLSMLGGLLLASAGSATHAQGPASLSDCAGIADDRQRLACFDRLAAGTGQEGRTRPVQRADEAPAVPEPATASFEKARQADAFSLSRHWELSREDKQGTFVFRPHHDNYVLFANYSTSPNNAPFTPLVGSLVPQGTKLSHVEVKFQLGFKMKLLEDLPLRHSDLWFGYTQQSYWQAYNNRASNPFRESDYLPELMLVVPTDYNLFGLNGRFVNFGLIHQSNGRGGSLSRSWNRFYLQTGLEKGDFSLLARAWKRIPESASTDDNPDILNYMGYGDLQGVYRWRGHEFSLLGRRNFHTNHGAVQLGWAFPLAPRVKGFVQAFSGYGQSLLDYNHAQQTIGLGIQVGY
ncbi:phospholipase A [Noviherbaspirillum massiliense]|uniref:phospholipase A n=1 Tax=Noviherbaspirillum massiliense TaxID=1465823 RepID=UPI000307D3E5|nr:phospholipase A [Noviherbaspirillum massiliense]